MQPFPKPDAPTPDFWTSQIQSMRAAAKEEYLRSLTQARGLRDLSVRRVAHKNYAPFYDVIYSIRLIDPKRPKITHQVMSLKTFVKKADAARFIDRAKFPEPIKEKAETQ